MSRKFQKTEAKNERGHHSRSCLEMGDSKSGSLKRKQSRPENCDASTSTDDLYYRNAEKAVPDPVQPTVSSHNRDPPTSESWIHHIMSLGFSKAHIVEKLHRSFGNICQTILYLFRDDEKSRNFYQRCRPLTYQYHVATTSTCDIYRSLVAAPNPGTYSSICMDGAVPPSLESWVHHLKALDFPEHVIVRYLQGASGNVREALKCLLEDGDVGSISDSDEFSDTESGPVGGIIAQSSYEDESMSPPKAFCTFVLSDNDSSSDDE